MALHDESKVVVMVTPEILEQEQHQVFAARFRALGLTAYGTTFDESLDRLFELFRLFIKTTRKVGQLEVRLNRAGVEWYPRSQYERLERPYIDLDGPEVVRPKTKEAVVESEAWTPKLAEALAA